MPLPFLSSHVLILVYIYLCGSLVISVRSGTLPEGSPCSTANSRIDKLSHRFIDDCDDKTFCSGSVDGTCTPKRCRTDMFPFGYKDGTVPPPLCSSGSFCPDEGDGCRPFVGVGQPCQLYQDRQCAPPPNWQELASDWNFNGSLCLGSICSCVSSLRSFSLSSWFSSTVSYLAAEKVCERHAWTAMLDRLCGLRLSRPKRSGIRHYGRPPQLQNPSTLLQLRISCM